MTQLRAYNFLLAETSHERDEQRESNMYEVCRAWLPIRSRNICAAPAPRCLDNITVQQQDLLRCDESIRVMLCTRS